MRPLKALAPELLPQEEFPDQELSAVVEGRADNSSGSSSYPEDITPEAAETHWFALDAEFAVDVSECR